MPDEEENILILPSELPPVETNSTSVEMVVAPPLEESPEKEPPKLKHKKVTKRKPTTKRTVHHKKDTPFIEPNDFIVPPVPISHAESPASETRPDITASLENIYRDRTNDNTDMSMFEIKKTNVMVKFFGWFLFIGVVGCAAGLLTWWYLSPNIKSVGDQVELSLQVPNSIELGATTTITIAYTNNEAVAIRNTVLQAYYPTGFVATDASLPATNNGKNEWLLGTIPAKEKRTITVMGQLYAPLSTEETVRVLLSYRPDGFESTFQKNVHVPIIVSKSPFTLSLTQPAESVSGVAQPYTFTITQSARLPGIKLILQLTKPDSFSVSSSTIPLKDGRFVLADKLFSTSTNGATVSFNGTWGSSADDAPTVLGTYLILTPPGSTEGFSIATTFATTTLVKNEITLTLAINGSTKIDTVQPGDVLATTLQIANNGKTVLKNGSVKLVYDGPAIAKASAFNWATLIDTKNGTVTGEATKTGMRRGTIVWTSKQIPGLTNLPPGATVLVDVTLPIKDTKSFDWGTVLATSNFSVQSTADFTDANKKSAHIESPSIAMKLRTDVAVEVRDDSFSSNPLTHQITWIITNNLHSLKSLDLTATLYGDITFTPPTTTPAGTVTFDVKTKELHWVIPEMPVGVDVLAMPFTVTINKPNPTQSSLESKVRFKATDVVTSDTIELLGEEITIAP